MINKIGLEITEKEYRRLPQPSYSLLSSIVKSGPTSLYEKKEDISDLDAIVIGSIVDSLVTEHKYPDTMVVVNKKPSGKALKIIKAIHARKDLVDKYLLSNKNLPIVIEECEKEKYYDSSSDATRITHLKKYNTYIKALVDHGEDVLITSTYQKNEATDIANRIFMRFPFLNEPNILGQVKLVEEYLGIEVKAMLDFIQIDYENKVIYPYDLKTGMGEHNEFFIKGYLNWNYYLQASLYKELLTTYIKRDPVFKDFRVDNFRFLYCGRLDKLPIIYKVTDKWHNAGLQGFRYVNNNFKGVNNLIEDYKYYLKYPNSPYRKGFDMDEIEFDDSVCNIKKDNG